MLTVKHIRLSGEEDIYLTPAVNYVPAGTIGEPATVWIEPDKTGTRYPLTGGTMFVMNDIGKTVARYDIGASMAPIETAFRDQPNVARAA